MYCAGKRTPSVPLSFSTQVRRGINTIEAEALESRETRKAGKKGDGTLGRRLLNQVSAQRRNRRLSNVSQTRSEYGISPCLPAVPIGDFNAHKSRRHACVCRNHQYALCECVVKQVAHYESQPRIQKVRRSWNQCAFWDEIIGFKLILNHFSKLKAKGGLADVPALQRSNIQTEFKDQANIIEASNYS